MSRWCRRSAVRYVWGETGYDLLVILLIDNYDSFTWNLVQRLGEIAPLLAPDLDLVVVRNDKITPAAAEALDGGRGPTHVIISPGPCTPNEAGVSAAVIERFAGRVPVLGVCLGHQCMGAGAGMVVDRHPVIMHGKTSPVTHDGLGVFKNLSNPFTATRYHSLVVRRDTVPRAPKPGEDGWIVSATSVDVIDGPDGPEEVEVVMGLRRVWAEGGKAPMEGVQFHPESFLTLEGPLLLQNFLERAPAHAGG